jgi:hypothetical protein
VKYLTERLRDGLRLESNVILRNVGMQYEGDNRGNNSCLHGVVLRMLNRGHAADTASPVGPMNVQQGHTNRKYIYIYIYMNGCFSDKNS